MTETTDILQQLSRPLDRTRVRRRQAPGEGSVPYLEGFDVIQTANQIFGYRWSFELLSEPEVMIWDQAVTTWDRKRRERIAVLDSETGKPRTQRVGMVYLTGRVTIELDGKPYIHANVGRLSFSGDTPEVLDTALSGAATDCLKRCFRQLGDQFGLCLYDKNTARSAGKETEPKNEAQSNGKHPVAETEMSAHASEQNRQAIEQAKATPCPVGSSQNPQWAGLPLGQVLAQPRGEKMLAYLAGEQFKANDDPARQQAKEAARVLLGRNGQPA